MQTVEQHPPWCAPSRCEASLGRYHSSRPVVVPRQRGSSARLQLRIWGGDGLDPRIELVVGDHDEQRRVRLDLTADQARRLAAALGRVLDALDAHPLPPHTGFKIGNRHDRT